ncbi:MAG: GNAT family N-acetyltransferase [Acidimicrobiia bacterium]|nr:GNAT family N-acetyltransferase [Acidimicrobiia bacterium]
MIVIRRPVLTDAASVGRAWEDARQFYSNLDSRAFLPPNPEDHELGRAIVEKLIAAAELPDRWIRIAELDAEAVGFITATLHQPVENANREIMRDETRRLVKIDTLAVQRSYWRKGFGRTLIEDVEDWAKGVEATLLKVGTYAHSPAVAFYETLGYSHRAIIFEKYLD